MKSLLYQKADQYLGITKLLTATIGKLLNLMQVRSIEFIHD